MAKISPAIKFNDEKCREGMEFYKNCFGGELTMMTVKGSPMAGEMPADKQELIMHSTLVKDGWQLIGSDMMRDRAVVGDNVSVTYECDSEEEIKDVFAKLSEGGEVFMPLEDAFWGATFGVVTDRYGVEWMLNFQKVAMTDWGTK